MNFKQLLKETGQYFNQLVNLKEHIDTKAAAENILGGIRFSGPNVFILFFAIIIASLGLNVNSIPVIIGAMLISPLMGPIIGFGLGLGTNDTELVKEALKNLLVMVVISILASTLYFLLTPLSLENPTELLARTNPNIYDVLIALFGGLAGILEISRKEKGTVLSGVAIATALMPPLCTVGYGIAQQNWQYALGAIYLFFINSVFIASATFIMVKYLRYPSVEISNDNKGRLRKAFIYIILVVMLIPGIFSTIDIVRENNIRRSATKLIANNKTIGKSYIYDYKLNLKGKQSTIDLYMAGEQLDKNAREEFYREAELQGFSREQLLFHEEALTVAFNQEELVKDIFRNNEERLRQREMQIDSLENILNTIQEKQDSLLLPTEQITKEIISQYSQISNVTLARGEYLKKDNSIAEQIVVIVKSKENTQLNIDEQSRLSAWLKVRLKTENLVLIADNPKPQTNTNKKKK
ncbi:MAG: DUF389 domain-containing protein [Paludibacteraceae bacterium]|nr:DUF389 domain-containing protein [Paludibacteraceae bacterium]